METCFNYTDREHGFFSSDERRFITKVRKLKEKYPERNIRVVDSLCASRGQGLLVW